LQLKNKFLVSFITIFGTLSFIVNRRTLYIYNHSTHVNGRSSVIHIVLWPLGTLPIPTEWNDAGIGLPVYAWDFRVATFHFPNPARASGTVPPADGRPGVSPPKNFWNSVCDLVHFDAIWWPPDPVHL